MVPVPLPVPIPIPVRITVAAAAIAQAPTAVAVPGVAAAEAAAAAAAVTVAVAVAVARITARPQHEPQQYNDRLELKNNNAHIRSFTLGSDTNEILSMDFMLLQSQIFF